MLSHVGKIVRKKPLLAMEFIQHVKLLAFSIWGLNIYDNLVAERNIGVFGDLVTHGHSVFGIVIAMIGLLSTVTARVEHRKFALLLAFLAYSFTGAMATVMYFVGGYPHIVTLIMSLSGVFTCAIIRIHLSMLYTEGRRGKDVEA